MKKRKICVVTGTRAEYGLLYWLMKEIKIDDVFELQIVVTGMHLAKEHGNTYKQIETDGFCRKASVLLNICQISFFFKKDFGRTLNRSEAFFPHPRSPG